VILRRTVEVVVDLEDVAAFAEARLAQALPRRWRHVRSVAGRARWVAKTLCLPDDLIAAAWPRTWFRLIPNGREAFQAHVAWLQQAARVRPEDAADDTAAPVPSAVHAALERS
jgi:hypothetical protein